MAILKLEGQEIELDERMAQNDKALLEFVATFSPELANATITRKQEGNQTVVTLTKRAGSKGSGNGSEVIKAQSGVVTGLLEAPLYLNPALLLGWQLKQAEATGSLTLDRLLRLQTTLAEAIEQGETELELVENSLKRLLNAPPVPSKTLPTGF
jgi:hypothetical protein